MTTSGLDGLRVVEITQGMAGEMAGMVLADNGAEVIKIERPKGSSHRAEAGFRVWNRGKRSVVADLATAEGLSVLAELIADADALVEDLRPATVERLGMGYPDMKRLNPSLVYVALTGFGEKGPLKDLPGYDYIVSAKSGRMADQVTVNGIRPAFTPTPIGSFGTAMLAVQGLLAAIHHRNRGAAGQRVHTSLAHMLVTLDMTSGHGHRIHTPDTSGQVYGVMPLAFMTAKCKDGVYLQMCSRFPQLFRNWIRVLGMEHLYDDPAYSQMPDVFPSQEALDEVIATAHERMAQHTRDEWLEIFSVEDVGANPFLTPEEFLECEQARVTGTVVEVEDSEYGTLRQIGPIATFSETPATIGVGAPRLGQDGGSDGVVAQWRSPRRTAKAPSVAAVPKYPLDDICIVEAAFAYATPQASTLMAEMGARVIKVEPPQGDPARRNWRTTYCKEMPGKESVVLDLKTDEGRKIIYELIAKADVFVHNFRPGVPDRLGVDYNTLRAMNDQLIYVYGSCYGSVGPWAHLPGFHSSPNAIGGTGVIEAGIGNPPQNRTFGDPAGALVLAASIQVALHARQITGRGQYVEGTMLGSLAYAVSHHSVTGGDFVRPPLVSSDQQGFGPWCRLYGTTDGQLLLCCPRTSEREAFRGALARYDEHLSGSSWPQDEGTLQELLERILKLESASTWEKLLLDADVPAVRADDVNLFDFMLRSEQMRANDLSIEDEIEGVGRIWRGSGSVEFSGAPIRTASPVPLGHDTDRVLTELGYSAEDVAALHTQGVTRAVGQGLS